MFRCFRLFFFFFCLRMIVFMCTKKIAVFRRRSWRSVFVSKDSCWSTLQNKYINKRNKVLFFVCLLFLMIWNFLTRSRLRLRRERMALCKSFILIYIRCQFGVAEMKILYFPASFPSSRFRYRNQQSRSSNRLFKQRIALRLRQSSHSRDMITFS